MPEKSGTGEEHTSPFPAMTVALLAVLLIAFVVEAYAATWSAPNSGTNGTDSWTFSVALLQSLGALSRPLVLQQWQWWRLITAPLLHVGPGHLFFNGLALVLIGTKLERLIGPAWLLGIFVISALSGGIFSLVVNSPNTVSVGASGGVVGLFMTAALASFHFKSGSAMRKEWQRDAMRVLVPTLLSAIFLFDANAPQDGIDVAAHVGGAVGGYALGLPLLRKWGDL
jgi:rhomboid protease GluP